MNSKHCVEERVIHTLFIEGHEYQYKINVRISYDGKNVETIVIRGIIFDTSINIKNECYSLEYKHIEDMKENLECIIEERHFARSRIKEMLDEL